MTLARDFIYECRRRWLQLKRRRIDYALEERQRVPKVAALFGIEEADISRYESEYDSLSWFHDVFAERFQDIHHAGVSEETTHWRDGKTLYVLCRALKPSVVVETGVRFGSFDAHILAALTKNEHGELHALDLPGGPPGPFEYGYLIPDRCRSRWTFHACDASTELESILSAVGPIDLFLHDSDHRAPHMRFEFSTAIPHIRPRGVLASHDVRLSSVFESVTSAHQFKSHIICDTGIATRKRSE